MISPTALHKEKPSHQATWPKAIGVSESSLKRWVDARTRMRPLAE